MIFDEFERAVREHWPTYKGNITGVWNKELKVYPVEQLKDALTRQRCYDYDATKPNWAMVIASLSDGKGRSTVSQLQIQLDMTRRAIAKFGRSVERLTDEDVFQEYLTAQCHSVTCEPQYGWRDDQQHAACDVEGARMRWTLAKRFVDDLLERGEQVPHWLDMRQVSPPALEPKTSALFRRWFPRFCAEAMNSSPSFNG